MKSTTANPAPGYEKKPEHEVTITPFAGRVVAKHGDLVLADTENALQVKETGYDRVFYLPGRDVNMDLLEPSSHSSFCPFKGHASYLNLESAGDAGRNIAWGYEVPFDEAGMTPMARSFYAESKRVDNTRIKQELGVSLIHPDYRSGLKALLEATGDA